MQPSRRKIGQEFEERAKNWFLNKGYEFIESNFYSRRGELDLILRSPEKDLVFVEVRYREKLADALESLDWKKKQSLYFTALAYLSARTFQIQKGDFREIRFDLWVRDKNQEIQHLPGIEIQSDRY